MHCGCPLPGETIGQKLNRLVGFTYKKGPSFLIPPDDEDLLAGTHPSDHNAVYSFHHKAVSDYVRKKREAKIAARRKRDVENASRSRMNPGSRARDHSALHAYAFLTRVPIFFADVGRNMRGEFASSSVVDNSNGGCAAVSYALCMWQILLTIYEHLGSGLVFIRFIRLCGVRRWRRLWAWRWWGWRWWGRMWKWWMRRRRMWRWRMWRWMWG